MAVHVLPPPSTCREGTATGCPTARPSRRDFLAAAGFTALAGISAVAIAKPDRPAFASLAPAGDDAELVAIGREAAELIEQRKPREARWWALPRVTDPAEWKISGFSVQAHAIANAMEPIDERLEILTKRAMALRATCQEAMAAKARLIRHDIAISHMTDGKVDFETMEAHGRMAWSLFDDLPGALRHYFDLAWLALLPCASVEVLCAFSE